MVVIKVFGFLREYVDTSQYQISGGSIQDVLDALYDENLELFNALYKDEKLRPHFKIMINGHDIELAQGFDTPVKPDDQIAIFPPIAGG